MRHNAVNPYQITKYNQDSCELELQREPAFQLFNNPAINGFVCLTPEDYSKLRAWGKTECQNSKVQQLSNKE